MSRRFICYVALAALFLSVSVFSVFSARISKAAELDRPNILWLTCEDMSPNMGCYGDPVAHTPTLDRLAEHGVRYSNAFGITGVCAVNRSCIITGMYSSTIGSHDMRSKTVLPEHIRCFSAYLRDAGYYCTNNSKTDYNFPVPADAWDQCNGQAHWKNRDEDQPFFAVFNYTVTHESQYRLADEAFFNRIARLTPEERHDPADVVLPPFHPDTPESRQDWARYYDLITAMDYMVEDALAELEEAGLADDTIVFFYSDHGVGLPGCKKWIWEDGLRVPMIVHFPEKYADWAPGTNGSETDRIVSFVDLAPTLLSLTGLPIPEHMQGFAFLGPEDTTPREHAFGIRDRMAERYDTIRWVRNKEYQYIRNFMPHLPWSQFVSYTEEMPTMRVWREMHERGELNDVQDRYFQEKPMEELYDIAADPHQINNLADDPALEGILREMRGICIDEMIETRDLGLLPEYELHRRAEGRTPYDVGLDPEANPLNDLLTIAEVANYRDADLVHPLAVCMGSEEPTIRYWAMEGLVALRLNADRARDVIIVALEDESPNVRVAAAEAVAYCGRIDLAKPVLLEALQHPTPFIRLRAVNVIDRLAQIEGKRDEVAAWATPAFEEAKMERGVIMPADFLNRMLTYLPEQWEAAAEAEATGE